MRYIIFLFFFMFIPFTYSYQQLLDKKIGSHKIKVIQVILDGHHKIISSLSKKGNSLWKLMNKVYWVSAINWAYFCPADYSNCWWKNYTNAPRFYKWKNYSRYKNDFWINWVFAFNKNNIPFIVMNHIWWNVPKKLDKQINSNKINDIYYGIWNFPVLLFHWNDFVPLYKTELSKKMKGFWFKAFICSTKDWKTIYMWYISNITIYDVPKFLKNNFSCYNALNLDAGSSLWLIYNCLV